MSTRFETIDSATVTGEPVAEVRTTPEALAGHGLAWERAEDELGPLRHAAVRLHGGVEALLVARADARPPSVTVIMRDSDRNEVRAVLAALGVPDDDLIAPLTPSSSGGEEPDGLHRRVAELEAQHAALVRSVETLTRASLLQAQGYSTAFPLRSVPDEDDREVEDPANVVGIDFLPRGRQAAG